MGAAPPASAIPRLDIVNVVRGIAIAGMVLFHLVWDLDYLGVVPAGIASHPLWLLFGHVLADIFMGLVGVSLVLASANGLRRAFRRCLVVLAAAALAITLVTRAVFPESFVYYGILNAIAVASPVGALALRLPTVAIAALGLVAYALGFAWTSPADALRAANAWPRRPMAGMARPAQPRDLPRPPARAARHTDPARGAGSIRHRRGTVPPKLLADL